MAQEAEDAGFDAVMLSEHVVLGRGADADGLMPNPRDYALPGNQDPAMPWPSSLVLLSAIAAATTRLRLAASAIIAPLRHPLLLAKDLATLDLSSEGRLVVQPTVSWHPPEYEALGVPYARRGALLDEHLAAWHAAWSPSPASFEGRFYSFEDVWVEPKPFRTDGSACGSARRRCTIGSSLDSSGTGTGGTRSAGPRTTTSRGFGRRSRRRGATSPTSSSSAEPAVASRTHTPRRPRRGARDDSRAGGARLHVDLHQAVAVPRRRDRDTRRGAVTSSRRSAR